MDSLRHDPRNVDVISLEETQDMIRLAGKTISCAWSVVTVHRKSTEDWSTILCFFDHDERKFAYAFEIDSAEQLEVLAERLRKSAAMMRTLEKKR